MQSSLAPGRSKEETEHGGGGGLTRRQSGKMENTGEQPESPEQKADSQHMLVIREHMAGRMSGRR